MNIRRVGAIALIGIVVLAGCNGNYTRTQKGAAGGAAAGAVLGGVIGHAYGNTTAGVILGAAIGGVAGGAIGHYMDREVAEVRASIPNANVQRLGEGYVVTELTHRLFVGNTAKLSDAGKQELSQLAATLGKDAGTNIHVSAFTDSLTNPAQADQLTTEQANAVANFLRGQNIQGTRISAEGYGATQPIASNATQQGQVQNRRIEIAVYANEQLKQRAMTGQIVPQ